MSHFFLEFIKYIRGIGIYRGGVYNVRSAPFMWYKWDKWDKSLKTLRTPGTHLKTRNTSMEQAGDHMTEPDDDLGLRALILAILSGIIALLANLMGE